MATYLKFLELSASPFDHADGGRFVLATDALRRTYAAVRRALDEGSPRVCVSGRSGIGKSSLAAALPKLLGDGFRSVSIGESSLSWDRLKTVLVKKLELAEGRLSRTTLEAARGEARRLVFIIDQAEKLDSESLEHLDTLLGYKDERGGQLVQCVLFANLEPATRDGECPLLWWLDRLTTTQLQFSPIPENGVRAYVDKHMKKAGWQGASLFTDDAILAIHRYTGGIPGTVGKLCEQLLARAAEHRLTRIDAGLVRAQCEPDASGDASPRGERPRDPRREPMLEHPPDEGLTEWPEHGPRGGEPAPPLPKPKPRPRPAVAPAPPAEEEDELRVEQGFVPMDEPKSGRAELGDFHVRGEPSWSGGGGTRALRTRPQASSRSRHGAGRPLRLLLYLVLAAAAYAYWPHGGPVRLPELREVISLVMPTERAPEPERAADAAGRALTSDLRVPDTSAAKPREDAPLALPSEDGAPTRAAREEPSPRPAAPAAAGSPAPEPWADQQPDPS